MHLAAKEYERLNDQFRATGIRYLSDYLRLLILDNRRTGGITNKKELIKQLDAIGAQIGKIGSNINQIAKYANIQIKANNLDRRILERFNKHMETYLQEKRNLINAYCAWARNKG
jgi:hypothetical protein